MTISNPTTLHDFFTNEQFINSVDKISCINTAILRYYLTGYMGKRLKSKRLNKETIKKQIEKLKKITVDSSFDIKEHLEIIIKGGDMYGKTKKQIKTDISYGKRFFTFVYKGLNLNNKEEKYNKNTILAPRETIMDKSSFTKNTITKSKITILKNNPNLFLEELKAKYPNKSKIQILEKSKNSLECIFAFINSFSEYKIQQDGCRKITVDGSIDKILSFIGWYKIENNLSIDELSIKSIFPIDNPYIEYDDLSLNDDNFISKIAKEEWLLRRKVKEKSKKFINIVKKFLEFKNHTSKATKESIISSLIVFSMFLYKDITDAEENDNFQDISLIKRLRVLNRDLIKSSRQEKRDKNIPFNWEEIQTVCERLRKEADQDYSFDKTKTNNKGSKLSKRHRACRLQNFLAIAFFCVMPPDRQRTIRELTLGGTLKYGIRENNIFRSHETLEPNEQPKYYIHLLSNQYKTGNIYGTYWYEINNVEYEDKRFYDYLNQWLFEGYRDELIKVKTNAVFIRSTSGESYIDARKPESEFGRMIKNIFRRKTNYSLNPHALRKIYITHINNLNLPEETRRAIAYMMHHDIDTANKTYNKQTLDEKIALGVDYLKQLH